MSENRYQRLIDELRAHPLRQLRHFDLADFLAHYALARLIARSPLNVIPTSAGDYLMGVPARDEQGRARVTDDGDVLWERLPVSGVAPHVIRETEREILPIGWSEVPYLGPYLHARYVEQDDETGGVRMIASATPEVRNEAGNQIRVLTLGWRFPGSNKRRIQKPQVLRMIDGAKDQLVMPWFRLHENVAMSFHVDTIDVHGTTWTDVVVRLSASHTSTVAIGGEG